MNMKKAKKKKKKIEKHKGNRAWTIFTNWDQQTFSSLSLSTSPSALVE